LTISERQFPIIAPRDNRGRVLGGCPESVPWSFVEPHRAQALANHSQTLERLAERGGLAPSELHAIVHDRPWVPMDRDKAVAWLVERVQTMAMEQALRRAQVESLDSYTVTTVGPVQSGTLREFKR